MAFPITTIAGSYQRPTRWASNWQRKQRLPAGLDELLLGLPVAPVEPLGLIHQHPYVLGQDRGRVTNPDPERLGAGPQDLVGRRGLQTQPFPRLLSLPGEQGDPVGQDLGPEVSPVSREVIPTDRLEGAAGPFEKIPPPLHVPIAR